MTVGYVGEVCLKKITSLSVQHVKPDDKWCGFGWGGVSVSRLFEFVSEQGGGGGGVFYLAEGVGVGWGSLEVEEDGIRAEGKSILRTLFNKKVYCLLCWMESVSNVRWIRHCTEYTFCRRHHLLDCGRYEMLRWVEATEGLAAEDLAALHSSPYEYVKRHDTSFN